MTTPIKEYLVIARRTPDIFYPYTKLDDPLYNPAVPEIFLWGRPCIQQCRARPLRQTQQSELRPEPMLVLRDM